MAMRVPQYGSTIPYPLVGPRHGRFPSQDSRGHGWSLAFILQKGPGGLAEFPQAQDRTIESVSKLNSIRVKITWPGYKEYYGYICMGSLGYLLYGIATVYKDFFEKAAYLEKQGETEDNSVWNISNNKLSINELAVTAIVHHMDDIFYCDIVRDPTMVPKPPQFV